MTVTDLGGRRADEPKKETIAFLKQFARAYFAVDTNLGVVLN